MARPSPETLEAWRLLLDAHHRLTRTLDAELRERHGFGLDWYDVLFQLSEAGGRLRMHELAEATLFSRADATRLVTRMQQAGLVERERDETDRRGVHAVLTARGRATLRRAAVTHLAGIEQHFASNLEQADAARLAAILRHVLTGPGRRSPSS